MACGRCYSLTGGCKAALEWCRQAGSLVSHDLDSLVREDQWLRGRSSGYWLGQLPPHIRISGVGDVNSCHCVVGLNEGTGQANKQLNSVHSNVGAGWVWGSWRAAAQCCVGNTRTNLSSHVVQQAHMCKPDLAVMQATQSISCSLFLSPSYTRNLSQYSPRVPAHRMGQSAGMHPRRRVSGAELGTRHWRHSTSCLALGVGAAQEAGVNE
jgi:hypothetical protein